MNHIAEHHDAGKNCKFEITLGHTASISCEWKDQGWGNQKGTVLVMGNNGVAPSECAPRHDVIAEKGPAPRNWSRMRLSFRPETGEFDDVTPR